MPHAEAEADIRKAWPGATVFCTPTYPGNTVRVHATGHTRCPPDVVVRHADKAVALDMAVAAVRASVAAGGKASK